MSISTSEKLVSFSWLEKLKKWFAIFYMVSIVAVGIYFAFSFKAKFLIVRLLERAGMITLMFMGGILMTIGFPLTFFELALARAVPSFWQCFLIAMMAHVVGSILIYIISKYILRSKIEEWLGKNKIFITMDRTVKKSPWKIVFLVKAVMVPLVLKSYGLGVTVPSFLPYFIPSLIVSAIYGMFWIHLGADIDHTYSIMKNIKHTDNYKMDVFHKLLIILSALVILYISNYAKKIYDEIEKEADEEVDLEKECKLILNKDSNLPIGEDIGSEIFNYTISKSLEEIDRESVLNLTSNQIKIAEDDNKNI